MTTALEKIELYSDRLSGIAQYLEDHEHKKAKYSITDPDRWISECMAYSEHMQKLQYKLPLLQGGPIPAPSNPLSGSRPVVDLRPCELTSNSNMSMVRAWEKQFEAYFVISNVRHLSAPTQHAFS